MLNPNQFTQLSMFERAGDLTDPAKTDSIETDDHQEVKYGGGGFKALMERKAGEGLKAARNKDHGATEVRTPILITPNFQPRHLEQAHREDRTHLLGKNIIGDGHHRAAWANARNPDMEVPVDQDTLWEGHQADVQNEERIKKSFPSRRD